MNYVKNLMLYWDLQYGIHAIYIYIYISIIGLYMTYVLCNVCCIIFEQMNFVYCSCLFLWLEHCK